MNEVKEFFSIPDEDWEIMPDWYKLRMNEQMEEAKRLIAWYKDHPHKRDVAMPLSHPMRHKCTGIVVTAITLSIPQIQDPETGEWVLTEIPQEVLRRLLNQCYEPA